MDEIKNKLNAVKRSPHKQRPNRKWKKKNVGPWNREKWTMTKRRTKSGIQKASQLCMLRRCPSTNFHSTRYHFYFFFLYTRIYVAFSFKHAYTYTWTRLKYRRHSRSISLRIFGFFFLSRDAYGSWNSWYVNCRQNKKRGTKMFNFIRNFNDFERSHQN